MSKFARTAQTSQALSLAAMEEASRLGLRIADIEHLFLALVINDQAAGRALRDLGIDLAAARQAVTAQHASQLETLGIDASFPKEGRIVFHETDGYEWSRRASDLIVRSAEKDRAGDAAAVLRELVAEPSGSMVDILDRLGTTPQEVLEQLDRVEAREATSTPEPVKVRGRVTGTIETFVPAPIDDVWEFLADPTHVPDWEMSIDSVDHAGQDITPGAVWHGLTPAERPDGRRVKVKPRFRRRSVTLVAARRSDDISWSFAYPDAPGRNASLTEFALRTITGGTQVRITTSWTKRRGWRNLVALPLRPLQKFVAWIAVAQTGSALSRAFR